jgi:hypothetical protein
MGDGELRHHPGHADDALTFAMPLLGDFEVNCEINLGEHRAIRVDYGGLGLEIAADGKSTKITSATASSWSAPLDPPLDLQKDWHAYRLTVRSGSCQIALDGRVIHDGRLSTQANPWLSIHSSAHDHGGVRKLQITGRPVIPDQLDLASGSGLRGWRADYFAGTAGSGESDWLKVGDQIRGNLAPVKAGRHQESVLQYERPLSGNDAIEYEFEYQPGRVLVNPALDRLVFVLDPSGVVVHWLTDADGNPSALTSDNRQAEPANRRGPASLPLREGEWNRLKMALNGDKVTVHLNGTEIYERTLEPSNRRIFGFFHDADQTEARVRTVRYRGAWPRTLPEQGQLLATH